MIRLIASSVVIRFNEPKGKKVHLDESEIFNEQTDDGQIFLPLKFVLLLRCSSGVPKSISIYLTEPTLSGIDKLQVSLYRPSSKNNGTP